MNDRKNRYAQQIILRHIGAEGQKKLASSKVAIVGAGALGCAQAQFLARAGVGFIRIIDGDSVQTENLHRQILYTEKDAEEHLPKAAAAGRHLREINRGAVIEEHMCFLRSENAESLLQDADLVMDATDNMTARCLINEVCVKHDIPWIYGGAVESEGMTMNILPGGPCFICMTGEAAYNGETLGRTARTVGVLNTLPSAVASIQCTEALKILTGSDHVRRTLLFLDLWENEAEEIRVEKNPSCPVCGRRDYRSLNI